MNTQESCNKAGSAAMPYTECHAIIFNQGLNYYLQQFAGMIMRSAGDDLNQVIGANYQIIV
ncbi:MAG TPA: hypothetical protein VFS25_25235 [Chitinophaga sp.]|uniref:hypothetical protein n=1 Tax=Chitinophaga sp. TaxID=1869181 RepID=UPI002DBF64A3|nr:hypothetical protein [Chitinophaga sp.]HEU4556176.1 hypothetical protein [Chitinophaga sp.]